MANFSCLQLRDKQKRRLSWFIEIDDRKAVPAFCSESLGNVVDVLSKCGAWLERIDSETSERS